MLINPSRRTLHLDGVHSQRNDAHVGDVITIQTGFNFSFLFLSIYKYKYKHKHRYIQTCLNLVMPTTKQLAYNNLSLLSHMFLLFLPAVQKERLFLFTVFLIDIRSLTRMGFCTANISFQVGATRIVILRQGIQSSPHYFILYH